MRFHLREPTIAFLFLVPAFLALAVFLLYPILQTGIFSLYELDHTTNWLEAPFVGLDNYRQVLTSHQFWLSLRFTLYFTVVSVTLEFLLGLAMALATFWVVRPLQGILRAIIIVPWAIPAIIQAAMWKWLYNSDVGLLSDLLVRSGLVEKPPLFLADPVLAAHSVIIAYVWKGASITAIFLMGGLAMVPQHLYDAAKVDGARAWMRLRQITLPLILPTILVTLLFRTMDGLRVFDIVYGLTGGGPGTTTDTLSSFAYKFYFKFVQFGAGSAYAIFTFGLVLAVSLLYIRRITPHLQFRR
jgi:ABC-type sugar transport system permease subunit